MSKHGRPSKLRRLTKAGSGPAAVEACSLPLSLSMVLRLCAAHLTFKLSKTYAILQLAVPPKSQTGPGVLCAPRPECLRSLLRWN